MVATPMQTQVTDRTRVFSDEVPSPSTKTTDREIRFPGGRHDRMARLGRIGIGVPADLRGPEIKTLTAAIGIDALSSRCASVFGCAPVPTGPDGKAERVYHDAKIAQIYKGTPLTRRRIIARELGKEGAFA